MNRPAIFTSVLACCALLAWAGSATAQPKAPAPPEIKSLKATAKVWISSGNADIIRLNETLVIELQDDGDWIGTTKTQNIVLFLNCHAVPKLPVLVCAHTVEEEKNGKKTKATHKELHIDLLRTKDNKDAWSAAFADLSLCEAKEISVTIGTDAGGMIPSEGKIRFALLEQADKWVFVLVFTLIAFFGLAWGTNMMRDPGAAAGQLGTLSLGRCQMALPTFPRWLGRFGMTFAPTPWKARVKKL